MTHRKFVLHDLFASPPPLPRFREKLKIAISKVRTVVGVEY